jgi:predicted AAA+ superfamily ATPase
MYRKAIEELKRWKFKTNRKPLMVYGARQVGKTWLLKEFGQTEYTSVAYIMMADNARMQNLFSRNADAKNLIAGLEVEAGFGFNAAETLIVLDEIQEVPQAITALKYIYEQTPEYHVACAGSLLGVAIHKDVSFPVGKVNSLYLYPLDFGEFLRAVKSPNYAELLDKEEGARGPFHDELNNYLRTYFVLGGMPEVVKSFVDGGNYFDAREIQKQIIADYEHDFGKHAPANIVPRIQMVFNSIPSQLAKENKKFIYGVLKTGARAKDFELAIQWLVGAGILLKVPRVNTLRYPLKHYEDLSAFKLFFVDVGLLGALSGVEPKAILEGNDLFVEYKGAMTEQYAAQQMVASNQTLYYYTSDDSKQEIDFVRETGGSIIPIEVKSVQNLASKSLKFIVDKYGVKQAIKYSLLPEKRNEVISNMPLYLAK